MIKIDDPLRKELLQNTRFSMMPYENRYEALQKYAELPTSTKKGMAKAYKDGFGGPPWKEVCECPNCGAYSPDTICRTEKCGAINLPEAYPIARLLEKDFPDMLTSFVPGVVVIAQNIENGVVGFCAGGMTTIDTLLFKKWNSNQRIGDSIRTKTGIKTGQSFFYENEMVVNPKFQDKGIGSQLNKQRLNWIMSRGIDIVVGRSININLINMKNRQMPERGFSMKVFVPDGDTYAVDGARRQCYFAQRK